METENKILERFISNHTDEALQVIEKLDEGELVEFMRSLPIDISSFLLSKLNRIKAANCIQKADQSFAMELLEICSPSVSANILRILDKNLTEVLLDKISSEHSGDIRQILDYPEHSVGAYLDPRVFTLKENLNIGQALDLVRVNNAYVQSHIFVLSSEQVLVGCIELKNLVCGDPSKPIRSLMRTDTPQILANINVQALVDGKIEYEELPVLPITDIHGVFLGVIDKKSLSSLKFDKDLKSSDVQQASVALGDLYQIGLSGLLRSTSEIFWNDKNK